MSSVIAGLLGIVVGVALLLPFLFAPLWVQQREYHRRRMDAYNRIVALRASMKPLDNHERS